MPIKIFFFTLLLTFGSSNVSAKATTDLELFLQANSSTSFMNYEFHNLAYEAAQNKNYDDAYRIYLKLANKGDNRAEYNIGMMYMKGLGVKRKKMDAYKWLRRASKHGNKEATLYFKQMNDRYAKASVEKQKSYVPKTKKQTQEESVLQDPEKVQEKNSSLVSESKEVNNKPLIAVKKKQDEQKGNSKLLYIIAAFIVFIIVLALLFLKKASKKSLKKQNKKEKSDTVPQNSLVHNKQIFDSTYAHVQEYHEALLKQVNMPQIKADKHKTQIYYMFIYGMIDYFCQLEKLSDSQQRRIFTAHMAEIEGKENVTAITQSILEGQRDSSMYHYQAAGGISAQAWYEQESTDALSMLKKVLSEKRH